MTLSNMFVLVYNDVHLSVQSSSNASSAHNLQSSDDGNSQQSNGRKKKLAKSQLTLVEVTKNTPT